MNSAVEAVLPPAQTSKVLDKLDTYSKKGNLKACIRVIQSLDEASSEVYMKLVKILQEAPLDIDQCAVVANWFYSPDSNLPKEVLNDLEIWKNVLILGFRFGSTYRREDLRALVDRFNELFDGKSLKDQSSWELLVRVNITHSIQKGDIYIRTNGYLFRLMVFWKDPIK